MAALRSQPLRWRARLWERDPRLYTVANGWAQEAWTWHEAADTRVFRPHIPVEHRAATWSGSAIGATKNAAESARVSHRAGESARSEGARLWRALPRACAARAGGRRHRVWRLAAELSRARGFRRYPRHRARPSPSLCGALPGIPTIRPFEALACGIPLISAPWSDSEISFGPAAISCSRATGDEMAAHLHTVSGRTRTARRIWPRMVWRPSQPSHLRAPGRRVAGHRSEPRAMLTHGRSKLMRHRLLRFQPGLGLLERSGHLLSRHHPCLARARPSDHFLRAGCVPAAAAPGHGRSRRGPEWSSIRLRRTACFRPLRSARDADLIVKASGVGSLRRASRSRRCWI